MVVIFTATLLISAAMALLVSRYFYLVGYSDLEQREIYEYVDRAIALVQDDMDQLDRTVRDWAAWDDSYAFMLHPSPEYEVSNLNNTSLQSLGLSFIVYVDTQGHVRFVHAEAGIEPSILESTVLPYGNAASAIAEPILIQGRLYLLIGRRITKSDGTGPSVGTLFMGWPLSDQRMERYSRILGYQVFLDPLISRDVSRTIIRSTDWIECTAPFPSASGTSLIRLTVRAPRLIYNFGEKSLLSYLITILIVFAMVALIGFGILETLVFRSLRKLSNQLEKIAQDPYRSGRVIELPTGDEIALLGRAMNRTLAALHERIEERETMLHEIYHRVKNNLQIIVSLLQLQASSTDNPEVLDVLSESHRRVMTIANIQNQLYEGSDLTKISLGDFIYKLVVSCDPDQKPLGQVDLKIQMDSIAGEATKLNQAVSIDTAVPLGLVLSELLSNCYRHAFPDGRSGTIEVRGRRTDRDEIVVEIQDDGVGIAPEDRRPKGLGLVLAEILAAQINGTVDIQSPASGGTLCTLIFL